MYMQSLRSSKGKIRWATNTVQCTAAGATIEVGQDKRARWGDRFLGSNIAATCNSGSIGSSCTERCWLAVCWLAGWLHAPTFDLLLRGLMEMQTTEVMAFAVHITFVSASPSEGCMHRPFRARGSRFPRREGHQKWRERASEAA